MTTKDEALKRALDLLESMHEMMPDQPVSNAINMCRAALAQKDEQEPVAVGEIVQRQTRRNIGGSDTGLGYSDGYVTDTWKDVEFYPFYLNDKRRFAPKWNEALEVGTKLYAAPPKRKPLTDDEIMQIGRELGKRCRLGGNPSIDFDYARAIEQAHGIGVEHDAP